VVWLTRTDVIDTVSDPIGISELRRWVDGGALVVDRRGAPALPSSVAEQLATLPLVIVELVEEASEPGSAEETSDVVVHSEDAAVEVVEAVDARPLAATSVVLLLRDSLRRSINAGIVAESACYSMLQGGPEFQAWLRAHRRRDRPVETEPPVRVERDGTRLRLVLNRPHVRNAFDARTREALLDGLLIASADPALRVDLAGEGPAFCSGGDLDEFGTAEDPASAHLVRVARSPGCAIAGMADRVSAFLHGPCIGAGIELPAFAGRVVAAPGATFALPEVAMGLVPGAGGTVSIPRRIGRQRTAWLAITGRHIGAGTARAWGLIDEIAETAAPGP
jgi:enoyl-CoA hydratase/carnithine racemase